MVSRDKADNSSLRRISGIAALWKRSDGVAALEFALVGPVFIALLIAILNTILIYLAQEGLETAAESATRLLVTGQAQTISLANGHVGMTGSDFKNVICNGTSGTDASGNAVTIPTLLPAMLSCSKLTVNVKTVNGYNLADTAAPTFTYDNHGVLTSTGTGFSDSNGGTGRNKILVLQLVYLWPTTLGPLGFNLSNQPHNNRMIVATSVVTTEAYDCSSSQTSC